MNRLLPSLGVRRQEDAHQAFGYRGIIAAGTLLAVAVVLGVSGLGRAGMCQIDSSLCAVSPSASPTATRVDVVPGELPAASDEVIHNTGAGVGAVRPGLHDPAEVGAVLGGDYSLTGAPWEAPATAPVTDIESLAVVPLDQLPCGGPGTGPCDVWESLEADSTADQGGGAMRLTHAGLDPYHGAKGQTDSLDLTLQPGSAGLGAAPKGLEGDTTDSTVLYRSTRRRSDGARSTSWTMTGKTVAGLTAVTQLGVYRTHSGLLNDLVITRVVSDPAAQRLTWTTVTIVANDSTRPLLEDWVRSRPGQGLEIAADVLAPTGPVTTGTDPLTRVAHSTAAVTIEVLQPDPQAPPLDAKLVLDHPSHEGLNLTLSSKRTLSAANSKGLRAFEEQQ